MSETPTIDTLLRGVAIAIPVAVLASLLILLVRRRLKTRQRDSASGSPLQALSQAAPAAPPREATPREITKEAEAIRHRIESALAVGGNTTALAPLYLDLASCHAKLGNEEARLATLRSAAAYGMQHGPLAAHATARLELAEAAFRSGDLTSACEQWQLARTAYLEDGQLELHARIEERMRANGCPTDWVLTGF